MRMISNPGRVALLVVLVSVGLFACNLPIQEASSPLEPLEGELPTPNVPTLPINLTPDTILTPTGESTSCWYAWATQPLPEVTDSLEKYLLEAGYPNVEVVAEAFGENCVLPDGSVARFLTMYTDIRITLKVDQLENDRYLAEQAETFLRLILDYPPDKLPGSLEGYLGINFEDPQGNTEHLWFKRLAGKEGLDKGLRGEELLEYLRKN
jgi:hypothetical protein